MTTSREFSESGQEWQPLSSKLIIWANLPESDSPAFFFLSLTDGSSHFGRRQQKSSARCGFIKNGPHFTLRYQQGKKRNKGTIWRRKRQNIYGHATQATLYQILIADANR